MLMDCASCTCCSTERATIGSREKEALYKIVDMNGKARFNQLKKKTGYHQEILSRVLKRLVWSGYIWKDEDGNYNLCCKIRKTKKIR